MAISLQGMLSFVSPALVAAIAAPYPGAAIGGYITSRNMKNWYMTVGVLQYFLFLILVFF